MNKETPERAFGAWTGSIGKKFEQEMLFPIEAKSSGKRYSFKKELEWVKLNQPEDWDPTDPPTELANDLHFYVFQELKDRALISEDIEDLKIHTALGSSLDHGRGVDMIVEYFDKDAQRNYNVSVDITTDRNKEKRDTGANLILLFDKGIDRSQNNYADIMKGQAKLIVSQFEVIKKSF